MHDAPALPREAPSAAAARPPAPWLALWHDFRRNRGAVVGLVVVLGLVLTAALANAIAPYDPTEQYRDATLRPPSLQPVGGHVFLLGTDPVGRDILSRLIHGTRLSLLIGAVAVAVSMFGGVLLGLVAAFWRGRWLEFTIMRLTDVLLALPSLLLAVAVVAVLGPGLANAMIAIAIVMLPHFVRLPRGAAKFGSTLSNISRTVPAPARRDACTYSFASSPRTAPRVRRTKCGSMKTTP